MASVRTFRSRCIIANLLFVAACGGGGNGVSDPPQCSITAVRITSQSTTVVEGNSLQITASVDQSNCSNPTLTWSSSNDAVASVSQSGVVAGAASGTVVITAAAGGKSATVSVTVTPAPVASVTLSSSTVALDVTDEQTLVATPRSASGTALTGRTVKWTSSSSLVATVSTTGTVASLSAGSTTIEAEAEGKTAQATVTVTARPFAFASSANVAAGGAPPGRNYAGEMNQVVRTGVGTYTVTFTGIGPSGVGSSFFPIVTTLAPAANASLAEPVVTCGYVAAAFSASTLLNVTCINLATNQFEDGRFQAMLIGNDVLGSVNGAARVGAFGVHDGSSISQVTPATVFAWNSAGGAMTILRPGTPDPNQVVFQHGVSIALPTSRLMTNIGTRAACATREESPTETAFLCYTRGTVGSVNAGSGPLLVRGGRIGRSAGYAHVDIGLNANPITATVWQGGSFSSGSTPTATRTGVGKYTVVFPGVTAKNADALGIATSIQGSLFWRRCQVFVKSVSPMTLDISCYTENGAFADVPGAFSVLVVE
jgi:hypothetical protein